MNAGIADAANLAWKVSTNLLTPTQSRHSHCPMPLRPLLAAPLFP
jgi:hypothetical protein